MRKTFCKEMEIFEHDLWRQNGKKPPILIHVIDESGEDYLYSADQFVEVKLPPAGQRALLRAHGSEPRKNGKGQLACANWPLLIRRRPTLPRTFARSTIGPAGLNFRVRDGNGWYPRGKITGNSAISSQPSALGENDSELQQQGDSITFQRS
jgi:hypothetical protein